MKRIATQTIIMYRDKQRVVVKPKQMFDFTKAEIDEIEKTAGKDALRKPVNESEELVEIKLTATDAAAALAANATGGIQNADDSDANPNASTPAPTGAATSPVAGSKSNPKPAAKPSAKDEEL